MKKCHHLSEQFSVVLHAIIACLFVVVLDLTVLTFDEVFCDVKPDDEICSVLVMFPRVHSDSDSYHSALGHNGDALHFPSHVCTVKAFT